MRFTVSIVNRVPSLRLEVERVDWRAPRHRLGRGQAGFQRRHVGSAGLERISGRHQPPQFVEPKRVDRRQAEPAMAAVGRVEASAKEADALAHSGTG